MVPALVKANHVSSSQSDRSKRVTCRCIKSLNAHFVELNAHFVEHKNAKATRRVSIADNALAFGSCIITRLDRY